MRSVSVSSWRTMSLMSHSHNTLSRHALARGFCDGVDAGRCAVSLALMQHVGYLIVSALQISKAYHSDALVRCSPAGRSGPGGRASGIIHLDSIYGRLQLLSLSASCQFVFTPSRLCRGGLHLLDGVSSGDSAWPYKYPRLGLYTAGCATTPSLRGT